MTFQHTIPLDDGAAISACSAFFAAMEKKLSGTDEDTRQDILMELQSHLFEVLNELGAPHSVEHVAQAIASLDTGYIDELRIINSYAGTEHLGRVLAIASAFGSYMALGGKWAVIGTMGLVGYALSLGLILTAIVGLVRPDHVGYFTFPDGEVAIGYVNNIENADQLYGYLYSPIALVLGIALMFGLNKWLLHRRRHKET